MTNATAIAVMLDLVRGCVSAKAKAEDSIHDGELSPHSVKRPHQKAERSDRNGLCDGLDLNRDTKLRKQEVTNRHDGDGYNGLDY